MVRSADFLTVATIDYTPQAVATLWSARRNAPHSSFHYFAVDATADAVADLRRILGVEYAWINVFGPDDLGPERDIFLDAFNYYNAIEMCCLAKYVGIAYIFQCSHAHGVCVYADSDTFFLGDVSETFDEMGHVAVVLTPHQFGPSRDDSEHDHLFHGWINAGFFIVRREHPETRNILNWLINRISRRGYLAPEYGLSCDQTWVSALPFVFHGLTFMSWHPGLNVAYWNLAERNLTISGETILANDVPLLLFHFSGFDMTRSTSLSKHSNLPIIPGSVLEEVCLRYQQMLNSTVALRSKVAGLKTFSCSKAKLQERIRVGSVFHGLNIRSPTAELGLFTRLGGKLDSLLRRTIA